MWCQAQDPTGKTFVLVWAIQARRITSDPFPVGLGCLTDEGLVPSYHAVEKIPTFVIT